MPKKTYRTYFLKSLDYSVIDSKGEKVRVIFQSGGQIDSTAKYSTKDEAIQKGLEALSAFGRDFYLERIHEDPKPVEAPKVIASSPEPKKDLVTIKDSRRFRNFVEMKNAMKEAGLEVKPNWTYAAACSAAYKQGYDYQIVKAEA